MSTYEAAPNDSRYIPFTQQPYLCVPTSIQMIMHRNGVPLIPAEELGYHLGLTVPPEDAHLFNNPRVSEVPPSEAGYGTQIYAPEYEPNKIFKRLHIPFEFGLTLADEINDPADLVDRLRGIEEQDSDALLCFNHGVINGEFKPFTGHVVVFDRVVEGGIQIVDASPRHPKWRTIDADLMFDAIKKHGNASSGGIWQFTKPK